MGRLVGLELHNFKSYRGTSRIGFGNNNFISIIGPNGAGKSNMMDAISFVLGIRSSHLRSTQLKDLIYRGRLDEDDNDKDSLNLSDLESEAEQEENDDNNGKNPTSAYVMAIYEKNKDENILLKRTITPQGASEYRINDKVVTASEYSNELKKENILIKARNFLIFQGDVEQVAADAAKSIHNLIETVSGSIDFKPDYDSLKDDLEKTRDKTNGLFQKKRILNSELKQYKEQKAESDQFEKKVSEKEELIKQFKLWQLFKIEENNEELIKTIEELHEEIETKNSKIKKEKKAVQKLNSKYAKESQTILKQELIIDKKNSELKLLNKEMYPTTAKKEFTMKKIVELQRKTKELENDIEIQEQNVKDLETQKEIVEKSLKNFEKKFSKKNDEQFQLSKEAKLEYESLREEFMSKGGAIQEGEINVLENDKKSLITQIETFEKKKENYNHRLITLKENFINYQNQLNEGELKLKDVNEELVIKRNHLNETRIKKEKYLSEEYEINHQIKEVLKSLDDLNASQREFHKERKLRENVITLQRLFPGVKGLLCDLCKPTQKKYEIAVSTILGKNFDSIIVDNITVSQKCIAHLKEQRAGVASFIPLDSVDSSPPPSNLRHLTNNAKPILDVIDYDPALERAMQYACSTSMVCDDMKTAKYIRWEKGVDVKIVTLDGSLIHKGGLMTGGRSKNNSNSRSNSWEKSELMKLATEKDELLNKLQTIQKERPNEVIEKQILNEINELETNLPLFENTVEEYKRNVEDVKKEIEYQENLLTELENDLINKTEELTKLDEKIEYLTFSMKELQNEIYGDFSTKYKVDIYEYEYLNGKILNEKESELAKFSLQLSTLNNKIEFEYFRINQSRERLEKIVQEEDFLQTDLAKIKEERNSIQDKIELIESEIEIANNKIKDFEKELNDQLVGIKQKEETIKELENQVKKIFKKSSSLEEDDEKILLEKIEILKSCKIENVNIPLIEGSLDSIPIAETEYEEDENDGDDGNNKLLLLADQLVVDFNELSSKYKIKKDSKQVKKSFNDKLNKISEELSKLSPNSKAIERLKEVQNRLKIIEKEHNKFREEENEILDKFLDVKEKRRNKFMEAHNFLSKHVDITYKELTKSSAAPMGGNAYISLEDEEEPYDHEVKFTAVPPLKRFRGMDSLSGGELSVSALALLFAIHAYQPSPFFVLDEVDAALDNANVQRVANYIVEHAGPNFQFIVISLKNGLFEKSEALVGIYREQNKNSSQTLTLDLKEYPKVS